MIGIGECWSRIERWLAAHAPAALAALPAGALAPGFDHAEETLGFALPSEVKDFLAIHDGCRHWLHDRGEFLSLNGILEAWDIEFDLWGEGLNDHWAKPTGPIRKKWFARRWLPVLDARTGDYLCIDLDPPEGGKVGQVFDWSHTGGPDDIVAPGFGALLAGFVEDLEGGRYVPKLNKAGEPYLDFVDR